MEKGVLWPIRPRSGTDYFEERLKSGKEIVLSEGNVFYWLGKNQIRHGNPMGSGKNLRKSGKIGVFR